LGNGWRSFFGQEIKELPVGKAEVSQPGKDLAIVAIGSTVKSAIEAAYHLKNQGITATVGNAHFVKPLDAELLCSPATEIKLLITVEENALQGGFGSAVLELFEEKRIRAVQVKRFGIPDSFVEHGPGLSAAQIRNRCPRDLDSRRSSLKSSEIGIQTLKVLLFTPTDYLGL
jgi:1-deoxy-D-xylulose-5-phosphate synthase